MLAWAHGYTSTNYYMMFGGTNFGDWAAANITTTYDYAAPIRECGGVDDRYQAVAGMAHMIKQIGPKLTRAELEQSHVDGDAPAGVTAIVRRAQDGTRFVFNGSQKESAMGTLTLVPDDVPNSMLNVDLDLKPFDAKVLMLPALQLKTDKGEWLPKVLPLPDRPLPPAHAWVPLKLRLDAAGSGFIYLDGHPLGRWWAQGPQKDYFLPDCWLKLDGDNVVSVSLLGAEQDGVRSASVLPYDDLSEGRP